jgi:hypothetical protein
MTMSDENLTLRILRDIQRTLAGYAAQFDAQREATDALRAEVFAMRSRMEQGLRQQHACWPTTRR